VVQLFHLAARIEEVLDRVVEHGHVEARRGQARAHEITVVYGETALAADGDAEVRDVHPLHVPATAARDLQEDAGGAPDVQEASRAGTERLDLGDPGNESCSRRGRSAR